MTSQAFRVVRALSVIFTLAVYSALAATPSSAPAPGVAGLWSGTLVQNGAKFRVVLHVTSDAAGKLGVAMDSVDQYAMGIPGGNATFNGTNFGFDVPSIDAKYLATLTSDGSTLNGTWTQQGTFPLVLTRTTAAAAPTPIPKYPVRPPLPVSDLKKVLDQEMAPVLKEGLLSKPTWRRTRGRRAGSWPTRYLAYGTAHPDSIFEIGSITKTFTGLILAQMVVQKKVALTDPVAELLPKGFAANSQGTPITLLDLANQHSGLPRMPDNFEPENPSDPFADYDATQLAEYFAKRGLAKPANATFLYSNLGFGLLGYALSQRAGTTYAQLVQSQITDPLHLHDTVVTLSAAQRKRLIQAYDATFEKAGPWAFDAFAGAGAIKSTASDMLTYLDANLHPEKYARGAEPGSATATLPAAIALDHEPRADVGPDAKIALAWFIDTKTQNLSHSGGTGGYGSFASFNPIQDFAVVALHNRAGPIPRFVDSVGQNVGQLLAGVPAVHFDVLSVDEKKALAHPAFADSSINGPYHCGMTAFSLPGSPNAKFNPVSTGDLHVEWRDGKGEFSHGTWEHKISSPNLNIVGKLKLASGSYEVRPDGTGSDAVKWELIKAESPRACFQFFSPAKAPITTAPQLITMDKGGSVFYSTSLNPFSVLNVVCERDEKQ